MAFVEGPRPESVDCFPQPLRVPAGHAVLLCTFQEVLLKLTECLVAFAVGHELADLGGIGPGELADLPRDHHHLLLVQDRAERLRGVRAQCRMKWISAPGILPQDPSSGFTSTEWSRTRKRSNRGNVIETINLDLFGDAL